MKKLLPLVVVAVILLALVMLRQAGEKPVTIVDQVKMSRLVPESVTSSAIAKLEMYNGDKPDEKLVLAREEGSDTKWRATSHFNAPVQQTKIDDFIKEIRDLQGEFRVTAKDDAELEGFELTDAKAFHVIGHDKEGKEIFHVLAGKAPNFQTVFMRNAGANDVFVETVSLRSNAGFRAPSTEPSAASVDSFAPATSWVEKTALDLDKDKIRKVAITTPDRSFTFEAVAKETPAPPAQEGDAAAQPPAEEKKVEYEWKVAQGGPGGIHKQTGLDSLLRKLDTLTVDDIVDPAKVSEWGLDTPTFKCVVSVEGQDDVVIEGARQKPEDPGYVRLASAKEQFIYKMSKYSFDQLFPKASDLFDLPMLSVDKNAIDRIEITEPEGRAVLVKQDGAWTIVEPVSDLDLNTTTIDGIATAVGTWKAADYSDVTADSGLDAPKRMVSFAAGPDTTHTLFLGNDAKATDGVYTRLNDNPATLVMSRADLRRIFIPRKDLVSRDLFDFTAEEIASISVDRPGDAFTLTQENEQWKVTIDGTVSDAIKSSADLIAGTLADLQADNILYGQPEVTAPVEATMRVKTTDGTEHTLVLARAETHYQLKLDNRQQAFTITTANAATLLPPGNTLKKVEAPAPAAETPQEQPAAPAEPAPSAVPMPAEPAPSAEPTPAEPAAEPATPAPSVSVPVDPAPAATPSIEIPAPAPSADAPVVAPETNSAPVPAPDATPAPAAPDTQAAPVVEPAN